MSSYFDKWDLEVAEIENDENFHSQLAAMEEPRLRQVNLVTGDREFPDDLREKIQNIVATWAFSGPLPPTHRATEYASSCRNSQLSIELHSAFHEVARRRIETRFGMLSDSPSQILALRDEYDEENG